MTRLPLRLAPLVALGLALLALPLAALLLRVPWETVPAALDRPEVKETLLLSVSTSLGAALVAAALGLPLAAWLAGGAGPLRAAARLLVTVPIVLPPVVGGLALLLAFGRAGLVTAPLEVQLPFTAAAVVLAQSFVALPFLVVASEAGLRAVDPRQLEAARTLGASPWTLLVRVRLPLALPSLMAGLVLAWARALGEFGATITFAIKSCMPPIPPPIPPDGPPKGMPMPPPMPPNGLPPPPTPKGWLIPAQCHQPQVKTSTHN